jgi:hypothetical protein
MSPLLVRIELLKEVKLDSSGDQKCIELQNICMDDEAV